MPITHDTLRIDASIRIRLDRHVDAATRALVERWDETWSIIRKDWADVIAMTRRAEAEGKPLTTGQILRSKSVYAALKATRLALDDLADFAGVTIIGTLDDVTTLATNAHLRMIRSQLPQGETAARLRASLVRADQRQIAAIVERTTSNITSFASTLSDYGLASIKAELIRGVSIGMNPRAVAANIMSDLQFTETMNRVFNFTLNRALVVARTEMLDAHRNAAAVVQAANADVLTGWMWLAQLDTRTCPSCWGMAGSIHPLSEGGPYDHQQGRCARMPVVKPWKDLGFAIPEPPPIVPIAQDVFRGLTEAEQVAIMGRERLTMLQDGRLSWSELSQRRTTPGWRDSYVVRPLRDVRKSRLRVV